jgi:hypothetical protein
VSTPVVYLDVITHQGLRVQVQTPTICSFDKGSRKYGLHTCGEDCLEIFWSAIDVKDSKEGKCIYEIKYDISPLAFV